MAVITLAQARNHLRIDDETEDIQVYIDGAIAAAEKFLNRNVYDGVVPEDDETGILINGNIRIGILMLLGHIYLNRETVTDIAAVEVPMGAMFFLRPDRIKMGV